MLASTFLVDSPVVRKPPRVDLLGFVLMVVGFGCMQLTLDQGERYDWFDSAWILALAIVAVVAMTAFVVRELITRDPILDLTIFTDRNFTLGSVASTVAGFGFYASMLLLALLTQKLMGYDALTSGLVLAPGGIGQMFSLFIAGRFVTRTDQRVLLGVGFGLNATALFLMSNVSTQADYWTLAIPRLVQGIGMGFVFVPMQTLALATISHDRLPNATAAFNVVRNIGGSVGIAVATTLLSRRAQVHQTTLVSHVDQWDPETTARLQQWTEHFMRQGADSFTAARRALAMIYRTTIEQAQALTYMEEFLLLSAVFTISLALLPFMQRVRAEPVRRTEPAIKPLPAPVE